MEEMKKVRLIPTSFSRFPTYKRKAICKCKKPCQTYIQFIAVDDEVFFTLCLIDARQILKEIGYIHREESKKKNKTKYQRKDHAVKLWSDEEAEILKKLYVKGMSAVDIARHLKRSPKSVSRKIESLRRQGKFYS